MDWSDTPEQASFRQEVRDLLEHGLPEYYRRMRAEKREGGFEGGWAADRRSGDREREEAAQSWADALAERGWVAPNWPKEYGGAGLSSFEMFVYNQELAAAGAPTVGGQGMTLLGPTLTVRGTEEQKQKYLPKILSGETLWCQGYSEPGAGSDLASLQTRAIRDGDEWVINGQKIWTSNAHLADAIFVLVRTDPDAPKHRGITFVLVDDMEEAGVVVRPLINMASQHGFNETFFEDVRIPASNVVGDVNGGWYVAVTLLDFERSNIKEAVDRRRDLNNIVEYAHSEVGRPRSRIDELPTVRAEVADRYIESDVGFNFSFRVISMQAAGLIPNYEASTSRMFLCELDQRVARTGAKTFGLYSNLWDEDDPRAPARAASTHRYVTTVSRTIAGGSSEIQRNVIATRGLGLPRG